MHVQSVQNYCFSYMQICDLLVTVVDVVSLRSLLSVLKLHGIAFDHV